MTQLPRVSCHRFRMTQTVELPVEDRLVLFVEDPVVALTPWLAWGLLPYVTSALVAAVVAAALASATLAIALWRGERPQALELGDVALFLPLIAIGLWGSDDINGWFEDHADLVSNGGLTVFAFLSLLVGRPFTAPYTTARFPGLGERLTQRLDTVSTWSWGLGLAVATAVTWYGEYVLDDPDDYWTGWVFQLVPLVLAYHATLWFDRRAVAMAAGITGAGSRDAWAHLRDILVLAAPIGALAIVLHAAPVWVGETLIVIGLSLGLLAAALVRRRRMVELAPWVLLDPVEDAP